MINTEVTPYVTGTTALMALTLLRVDFALGIDVTRFSCSAVSNAELSRGGGSV